MHKEDIPIKIKCSACGGIPITEDNPTDDSLLTCESCGRNLGTYGELKKAAVAKVGDEALKTARKVFKDIGKRR